MTATIESDGERRRVVAEWVVGCDGHRSFVREAAGIDFRGTTIEAPWAVFDATVDRWEDDYDLVFPFLDQPPLILTPLPERRWRAYARPTSDSSDLVAEAEGVLRRYKPAARFTGVENPARFHCHSRVASRYREGRVLLAGDAAHACSPNEGHGMNTGLQDAFNLGWKLALVCRGAAGPGLLDTYETERRPVAELVVASGAEVESRACPHRCRGAGGSRRGAARGARRSRARASRGGGRLGDRPRLSELAGGRGRRRPEPGAGPAAPGHRAGRTRRRRPAAPPRAHPQAGTYAGGDRRSRRRPGPGRRAGRRAGAARWERSWPGSSV